ncbi:hypothetical protein MPSEU_001040000 [Mayamaea pseudoterrestris]|nr:hypothetical protein MPSEU_001040000 [Mayamaea pseudoterrestris]
MALFPKSTKQFFIAVATLALLLLFLTTWTLRTTFQLGLRYKSNHSSLGERATTIVIKDVVYSNRNSSIINKTLAESVFHYPIDKSTIYQRGAPIPIQVMEKYIEQHSVDALRKDPHPENRLFAIAFYQCPLQAGNHAHIFWNGILWSILTNRTVLYKYWDKETCLKYNMNAFDHICKSANTESDCAKVLTRAPWIASYDEWKRLLNNDKDDQNEPFMIPYHATMGRARDEPRFPVPDNYEQNYGVDLLQKYPYKVVVFPECYSKFSSLGEAELQETVLMTNFGRETVKQLFHLGPDFLYGMLHRYTFQLADLLQAKVPMLAPTPMLGDGKRYFTIGIHSRHRYAALDGCDISREIKCIQEISLSREDQSLPVKVGLMSDRTCTIQNLTTYLEGMEGMNVSVVTATHEEESPDKRAEHGPYAGSAFFVDMAVVSAARSAFIAMSRSSSDMMRELIVFDQRMEQWGGRGNVTVDVHMCILPNQKDPAAGFNMEQAIRVAARAKAKLGRLEEQKRQRQQQRFERLTLRR